jgi:pimeloyl-ACP methyl ester carboxylesterase
MEAPHGVCAEWGSRIHYEVERHGPPLLIHHGFSDSIETWFDCGHVDALKATHRVILLDARGHGQTLRGCLETLLA